MYALDYKRLNKEQLILLGQENLAFIRTELNCYSDYSI